MRVNSKWESCFGGKIWERLFLKELSNVKFLPMSIVLPNLKDDDDDSILSLSLTAVFIIDHVKSELVSDRCIISLDKWCNLEGMEVAIKGPQNFQTLSLLVLDEVESVTQKYEKNTLRYCPHKVLKKHCKYVMMIDSKVCSQLLTICTH